MATRKQDFRGKLRTRGQQQRRERRGNARVSELNILVAFFFLRLPTPSGPLFVRPFFHSAHFSAPVKVVSQVGGGGVEGMSSEGKETRAREDEKTKLFIFVFFPLFNCWWGRGGGEGSYHHQHIKIKIFGPNVFPRRRFFPPSSGW